MRYYLTSVVSHLILFMLLILGLDFATPLPVLQNTNKTDVISAVVLGDTVKSTILPTQLPKVEETPIEKPAPKPEPMEKPVAKTEVVKKEVVALKPIEKKKPADIFGKDLLADIEKVKKKVTQKKKVEKKVAQKKELKSHFEKTLRQHLLDEDLKLQSTESRQSQGEVDKYKALIVQAISEQWVVPRTVNRKLSSVLLIRLAPGGVVLDVRVSKSSGDVALDTSARAAVFKSSPLPVPKDPAAFESFREFSLKVKPENIL